MKSTKTQTISGYTLSMHDADNACAVLTTLRGIAVLRGRFSLLRDIVVLRNGSATRNVHDKTASQLSHIPEHNSVSIRMRNTKLPWGQQTD